MAGSSDKYRTDDGEGEELAAMAGKDAPQPQPRANTSVYENKESSRTRKRLLKRWKILAIIFMIVSLALFVAVIAVAVSGKSEKKIMETTRAEKQKGIMKEQPEKCKTKMDPVSNSNKGNKVFSGMSPEEMEKIVSFLKKNKTLNLVNSANATLNHNYIYSIEDYLPKKEEVTKYLDESSRQPQRQARVLLFMGREQAVAEYLVPIPNPRSMNLIANSQGQALSWEARPICNVVESKFIMKFIFKQLESLQHIYFPSFAPDCHQLHDCVYMNMAPRVVLSSSLRHIITWFFVSPTKIEDYYMYPLPFYIIIAAQPNATGDEDPYKVVKIYYNIDQEYNSVDDFKNAYFRDTNLHYTLPDLKKNQGIYGSPRYVQDGDTLDRTRKPPQQYYPDGPRFSVSGTHVEWLRWSFDIHMRTVTGMQIFDVKYKNERLAYELSMQDIVVLYSGLAPDSYFKNYFDNGWDIGTGKHNLPLIRGIDCPSDAIYLNSSIYVLGEDRGSTQKDAVCIFEYRNSIPMRHHYSSGFFDQGYRYAFSMPDSVLIVRQILTVWNYDYIFDYEFHQNGVVEAKVSSTGYIAVTTNLHSRDVKHGYIINPDWKSGANLHQHLFNFKFDLDVGGPKNNFRTVDIVSENQASAFDGDRQWYQMAMKHTEILKEKQAAIRYDFTEPKLYVMYNEDKKLYARKDGAQPRGYRIQTNSFSKVVLPDDAPLLEGGASWAKYQLAVTKQSDNERTTASRFVQGDPFKPAINFDDFIKNDESLVDTDLVAWVTVGLHHAPTYEDLPVTTTPSKTLTISLIPFNYFKRDPSITSRDAAVYWSKRFNDADDIFYQNDTCLANSSKPTVEA